MRDLKKIIGLHVLYAASLQSMVGYGYGIAAFGVFLIPISPLPADVKWRSFSFRPATGQRLRQNRQPLSFH